MPRVSVVLSVYNGERFLAQTLESVLHQTFQDFELIAVDDGSTDSTPAILATYQQQDSRIIIHRNPTNLGIPRSRNAGCQQARGDYIAVSDADDLSLPTRFAVQVDYLDRHPDIALVGSSVDSIDEDGRILQHFDMPVQPGYIRWALLFANVFAHSSVMLRREAAAAIGFYSEATPIALDYDLVTRMSMAYRLTNVPDVLLHYRLSGGSITATRRQEQARIASEIRSRLAAHYLRRPLTGDEAAAVDLLGGHRKTTRPEELRQAATLLTRLHTAFAGAVALSAQDRQMIAEYNALRRFALAAQAGYRAPLTTLRLLTAGVRCSPGAVPKAAAILIRRMTGKRS